MYIWQICQAVKPGSAHATYCLCRPVQRDTAQQLETALAVAQGASAYLSQTTRVAANNAAAEIQAGDTLQVTPHLHHNFQVKSKATGVEQLQYDHSEH